MYRVISLDYPNYSAFIKCYGHSCRLCNYTIQDMDCFRSVGSLMNRLYPAKMVRSINGCLILPATYIFYPETAGRSLEEMDDIFSQENAGWFNIVRLEKEFPRSEHRVGSSIRMNASI